MAYKEIEFDYIESVYNNPAVSSTYIELVNKGLWAAEKYAVEKYFSPDYKIIDLGCGAGRTTFGLYRMGYRHLTGLDLSEVLINAAREIAASLNADIPFYARNMLDTGLQDQSFDAAMISGFALMCIPGRENRLSAMRELKRILKPEGIVVFTTPEDRNILIENFDDFYQSVWKNSSMVPRDYGDLLFNEAPSVKNFGHFPTRDEVIQFIEDSQFNLCETYARTDIEPDTKEGIPGRYWVVKNKWQ